MSLLRGNIEGLQIRLAKEEDCAHIYAVRIESITNVQHLDYPPEQIKTWAAKQTVSEYQKFIEDKEIYVAVIACRIVAFGHLGRKSADDFSKYEIKALFVHPSYSRQGIGKKLYMFMENIAVSHGCKLIEVQASLNGEEFYKGNGFLSKGIQIHDSNGSCDCGMMCIRMVKQLIVFDPTCF